jgi:hypothetical protein
MASQSRHAQEPTSFSVTETIVERREASTQESKSFGIEDIETTTNPLPLFGTRPHPRERTTFDPRTLPPVIPPDHPNRTLILCFDGTGDQFDADNSNIVQLVSLLKKDERAKQLVYYQVHYPATTAFRMGANFLILPNRQGLVHTRLRGLLPHGFHVFVRCACSTSFPWTLPTDPIHSKTLDTMFASSIHAHVMSQSYRSSTRSLKLTLLNRWLRISNAKL